LFCSLENASLIYQQAHILRGEEKKIKKGEEEKEMHLAFFHY
jgi:hypothetical protein